MPSGSSGGPTSSTSYTSNLPDFAKPYFESLMSRAEANSEVPYQPYTGQRQAGTAADTTTAANATRAAFAAGSPGVDAAKTAAAGAAPVVSGLTGFASKEISSGYNPSAPYAAATFNPGTVAPGSVGAPAFSAADAARYADPYREAVTVRQKAAAVRTFEEGQGARDAPAVRAGGLGGYRNLVSEGVARRGLQNQLGDIDAAGLKEGWDQAQKQFNADESRALQAGTTTAQLGLTAQQSNQQAGLAAQERTEASRQYGATTGAQQKQFEATQDMQGQVETERARQQAAAVNQQGGAMALNQAQALGGLADMEQRLAQARTAALHAQGTAQESFTQRALDIATADFESQRDAEQQRLQQLSGLMRGVPVSPNTTVAKYENPNQMLQLAGLGGLALTGAART